MNYPSGKSFEDAASLSWVSDTDSSPSLSLPARACTELARHRRHSVFTIKGASLGNVDLVLKAMLATVLGSTLTSYM